MMPLLGISTSDGDTHKAHGAGACKRLDEIVAGLIDGMFSQAPHIVALHDLDMRIVRVNPTLQRLVGDHQPLVGRLPSELPEHGIDTWMVERLVRRVLDGERITDARATVRPRDAEEQIWSWSGFRVEDEHGHPVGAVLSAADVTMRARVMAETRAAHNRLYVLNQATGRIGTTLDVNRTAQELADVAVPLFAGRVSVDLLEPLSEAENPPGRIERDDVILRRAGLSFREDDGFEGHRVGDLIRLVPDGVYVPVLRQGAATLVTDLRSTPEWVAPHPQGYEMVRLGFHSCMSVPLIARGVHLGLATFFRRENPEPFDQDDLHLAQGLVDQAAVHIDNARRYTREHATALTLQRNLLPRDIPRVRGIETVHRYRPAGQALEVGGDWYDVITLPDGRVMFVVGDVTGHGVHAAAIMGQLRTTTDALAGLGHSSVEIFQQLDRMIAEHGDDYTATCVHVVYDPAEGTCSVTRAGHLPPALVLPDGSVTFVEVPSGTLLGAGGPIGSSVEVRPPAGSLIMLYTDGLVETRDEDIDTRLARLARTLSTVHDKPLDQICDTLMEELVPYPRDDVALLGVRLAESGTGELSPT